jgi:phage terminase large subunit GpA-like protein
LLLTCGVDTQDDRLEYEITGWGKEDESWGIEYGIIVGKPDDDSTWQMLDDRLNKIYKFESGLGLKIWCTFIDSGGHFTSKVYEYCKKNEHRRIFAVKGRGGSGIPLIDKLTRNTKGRNLLVLLGVDDGKTTIMSALKVKEPGPRYCHFPNNENKGYSKNYFHCLLSEKQELRVKNGVKRYVWEKVSEGGRNEALDTRNYALAAKEILKPNYEELERRFKDIVIDDTKPLNIANTTQKRRGVVKRSNDY